MKVHKATQTVNYPLAENEKTNKTILIQLNKSVTLVGIYTTMLGSGLLNQLGILAPYAAVAPHCPGAMNSYADVAVPAAATDPDYDANYNTFHIKIIQNNFTVIVPNTAAMNTTIQKICDPSIF